MIVLDIEQGTDAWRSARSGVPTCSNFDMIITTKGEPSKQRTKYLYKLAAEKVSGVSEETYQNEAMARGVELEDEARKLYQLVTDNAVAQVGFILSDCQSFGGSPDGLIGEDGGVEIKCPGAANHVEYLLNGKLPSQYFQQVQGYLFLTGRKYWDFVSYFPGIKPLIVRVEPDMAFQSALEAELRSFCQELNEVVNKLSTKEMK